MTKADKAVGAGRGLILITVAKLWFMVAGYVIQFALPRALGSPERFGIWTIVVNVVSLFNNVIVTATIQGVSKFTSERDGRGPAVTRAALRMHAFLGGGVALALFLGAPVVAFLLHDPSIVPELRVASGVVLAYSFYAVFVGAANGTRQFQKQAGLDITFSTLRATFVVGAALAAHTALASLGGFVSAATIILVLSIVLVGVGPKSDEKFPVDRLVRFFGGIAAYLVIVNALMFVDGFLLKRLVAEQVASGGVSVEAAASAASTQSGYYGAVQNIARLPYQLILAVTFVIFPLVSKSTFDRDVDRTRRYVLATMRYSLVVVALLAATLAARPEAVMRLLYTREYAVGAHALAALLGGYVCFSLFTIAGTIINGAGHTRPTFFIGLLTLAAAAAANFLAIRWALASGRDALVWAAVATAGAMALGLLVSGLWLRRMFGAFIGGLTVARTALSAAAAFAVGRFWPQGGFLGGKVGTLLSLAACGLAFLVVAIGSGELRPAELRRLRAGG